MSEFPSIFQNNPTESNPNVPNPFQTQQLPQQNYNQQIGARPNGPFNQTRRPRDSECKCCGGSGNSSTKQKNPFAEAYENWERNCNNVNAVQQQRMDSESNESGIIGGLNSPPSEHQCKDSGNGDVVCSQKNCPASIQLQAMVAQLLSVQGLIPSAITRLLLRRIPASNIPDSDDTIMERATRCIRQLSKEHLLRESGAIREINGLLGNYLTSPSTHARLIPILTSAQLKANVLRSLLEGVVSSRIMQDQGCGSSGGAEAPDPLDPLLLELKGDDELRQLLAQLREKQCDERVNLGFSSCTSQQIVAQSRLVNVERKIRQIEAEFERRRRQSGLSSSTCRQDQRASAQAHDSNRMRSSSGSCRINSTTRSPSLLGCPATIQSALSNFDSPNPFANVCLRNPKKLFLKPHVGSPETTYEKSDNDTENRSNCHQEPESPSDDDCCVGCENSCAEETNK
ncbi:hypothetical protein QAD02_000072 [Eretmocerus hayati]|uniref:Uncharacterized protein n=1 Tax=Eretmocerus hayati TaxID=131215 RepID=A0ACC2NCK3_9HYME|nr:hypothetical protein QAD02_000072 [Eretmocerus hayati]